jgi:DNA (cytosine-5)-methyltransferase 1
MNILSLFSNIGVAEVYLKDIGFNVVVANEILTKRANFYSSIHPNTIMINGDINDISIFDKIVFESIRNDVEVIMATPPCQGMSTAGQQKENDERNMLILPVIEVIKRVNPKYVFIENVPMFFKTMIELNDEKMLVPDLLEFELGNDYAINKYIIDTNDYSVPQTRERAIFLLTRKKGSLKEWVIPKKDKYKKTMFDAIGDLPKLDPYITDISEKELLEIFPKYYERKLEASKISHWHIPPHHIKRQVLAMQFTPTGCTAFDNSIYYPVKADGEAVKGYRNTYKRQHWDKAAYTVTMDNRKISSQNNVHPGRPDYVNKYGDIVYSDPRVLTLYEIMIIMSLPKDWQIPLNTSEAFLRRVIGEGIPPLFVKKVFEELSRR